MEPGLDLKGEKNEWEGEKKRVGGWEEARKTGSKKKVSGSPIHLVAIYKI